jgi:hypothetical protein
MQDTDIDTFMALLREGELVPTDLESRLLADGIDTSALREIYA